MKAGLEADRFGEFIVAKLRDRAIDHFDGLSRGHWRAPSLRPLQTALAAMTPEERNIVGRCVQNAVDSGLHDFLFALSEAHDAREGIEVTVDGHNVAEQSDGLHGELFGEDGWLSRFSKHGGFANPA